MGISSQAISVRASVNLSDINIDTDLDMGSNKLIAKSIIFNSRSLISDYEQTVKNYVDATEYTGVKNTFTNPVVLDSYTIPEDGFIFGKLKGSMGSTNFDCISHLEFLRNDNRFENPICATVTGTTYTISTSSTIRPQFVAKDDIINIVHYVTTGTTGKRKLVTIEMKFIPLTPVNLFLEIPLEDLTFSF